MSSYFSQAKEKTQESLQDAKEAASNLVKGTEQKGQDAKERGKELKDEVKADIKATPTPPAFADIAKACNDLLNKDFYHTAAATLEVKNKTPNGVTYTVKGKSAHDGPLTASLEGKYSDQSSGATGTVTWQTINTIDAKVELEDTIAKGVKAEAITNFKPESGEVAAKANLYLKQPALHLRVLGDLTKGPSATADFVIGRDGFLLGGEAAYDVQKAALTKYSAAIGYRQGVHHAAITATNNVSVFTASYYNKVNENVEAGAKATWDSKTSGNVGLELASKYRIDPSSFAKAKIDDKGVAALAYNVQVKQGFTFGIGTSFDAQKLNEGGHKVGASFTFEG